MRKYVRCMVGLALTAVLAGCSQESATDLSAGAPKVDGSPYRLTTEPEGATSVIAAREAALDGDEVIVVGRIGGGANPWVDHRAAFSIVDLSLRACSDIPGDRCQQPWDYCCETTKLPDATALVKIIDDNGEIVKADAKHLLSITELSTVIVQGEAQRDDTGNLTVLASGVYTKK